MEQVAEAPVRGGTRSWVARSWVAEAPVRGSPNVTIGCSIGLPYFLEGISAVSNNEHRIGMSGAGAKATDKHKGLATDKHKGCGANAGQVIGRLPQTHQPPQTHPSVHARTHTQQPHGRQLDVGGRAGMAAASGSALEHAPGPGQLKDAAPAPRKPSRPAPSLPPDAPVAASCHRAPPVSSSPTASPPAGAAASATPCNEQAAAATTPLSSGGASKGDIPLATLLAPDPLPSGHRECWYENGRLWPGARHRDDEATACGLAPTEACPGSAVHADVQYARCAAPVVPSVSDDELLEKMLEEASLCDAVENGPSGAGASCAMGRTDAVCGERPQANAEGQPTQSAVPGVEVTGENDPDVYLLELLVSEGGQGVRTQEDVGDIDLDDLLRKISPKLSRNPSNR